MSISMVVVWVGFRENFGDVLSVKDPKKLLDINKQFDDVIVYYNDIDGKIGYDKCIDKCPGFCVENGMTGSAFCYPINDYKRIDINKFDESNRRMVFPNV